MNILNVCKHDWAGYGINLTKSINQYTNHISRLLQMHRHRLGYETDILTQDTQEMRKWIEWADIINCLHRVKPYANIIKSARKRKVIVTYIGTPYRTKYKFFHKESKELGVKKELVDIPELTKYGNFEVIPPTVPVMEYEKMKRKHEGKQIVCQTPSRIAKKNTNKIIEILSNKNDIELLIINKIPWVECMKKKSVADIYLGSFTGRYGLSSIEAWSMGIPCINYIENPNRKIYIKNIGYLPYYESPIEKLPIAIDLLLNDKNLYNEYSDLGKKYVSDFHDYPVVAKKFVKICEGL